VRAIRFASWNELSPVDRRLHHATAQYHVVCSVARGPVILVVAAQSCDGSFGRWPAGEQHQLFQIAHRPLQAGKTNAQFVGGTFVPIFVRICIARHVIIVIDILLLEWQSLTAEDVVAYVQSV